MNDTPPEVRKLYREMLMARAPEERFRMGLDMFAAATALMLAGLRAEGEKNLRERVFLRLYGNEFAPEERARIIAAIRKFDAP